jgi:hypothetical protein
VSGEVAAGERVAGERVSGEVAAGERVAGGGSNPSSYLVSYLVPSALLVAMRQSSVRFERPLWDTLLLYERSWPLPLGAVVALLAGRSHYPYTLTLNPHPEPSP